ncbi:MAG TPA: tripartite tricarboxylate transporter permease [Falsiroseomonas sp.]|jgi:GAF domain-containing protein|nr:tripartite tricarboxylate transporter permease [Falsiroseomonas sp.]
MGALVRAHDWAATPLGPPEAWPPSLRVAVGMVLGSRFPACLVWGPRLITIYNDAFRPILGTKPEALGRPFSEVWAEAWQDIGPIAERALAGEATFIEDFPLTVERNGFPEEAFFTFCYNPVRDETGRVAGILDTVVETTGKVRTERRQAFLLLLEERLRGLADPHEITLAAAEALGRHLGAARAGYGEIDAAGETVAVERDWNDGTAASLAGEARLLDAFGPAVIAELRAGRTLVVEDCLTDAKAAGDAYAATWASIGTRALIVVPLVRAGRLTAILYVHEPQARCWSTAEVNLAEDAAHRTWAAVERAQAEAALRASEERFRFLDRLGEATAGASAPREIMAITARLLGAHLGVTRCAYADVDADNYRFTIRDDWTDGVPSSAEEYSLDLFGSRAAADMRAGRTLVMRDVDEELPAADGGDMFNAIGIKAIVCCPLVKQGRLVAMMAVHQSAPRDWMSSEISLVETVVERAWAHIERVRAEAALRESEERLRLIVEGTRDYAIFTTDPEGRINAWLPGAANVFGWSPKEAVGKPVAITFTPEDRERGAHEREPETARREGIAPGPMLATERPELFWGVIASMLIGNLMLLVLNVPLLPAFVSLLRVPQRILAPLILLFCVVGAYSLQNSAFDVMMVAIFGVVGFLLRLVRLDPAPFMLAFVLGELLEKSIRQSLLIGLGSPMILVEKPISAALFALAALVLCWPALRWIQIRILGGRRTT